MIAGTRLSIAFLGVGASLLPTSVYAQRTSDRDGHAREEHGTVDHDEAIVVTGHLPTDLGLLSSTATLEGDQLVAQLRGQPGEMLRRLPGVASTGFAPGASRPVLRGLEGDRIRVLVDGIGAIDASTVSADHAVVFDPLTVDHIDVVHGPAVLLFGGQAIGGAVNAVDKRIPRSVPTTVRGTVIGSLASAANERSIGAALDVPLGDRLVVHVDGSWRKSDDLRVGGFVNSPELRTDLLEDAAGHRTDGEPEEADKLEQLAGLRGRIPNSAARTTTFGAGVAFIDPGGNLGASVQRFDSRYGLPTRPGGGHSDQAHENEEPRETGGGGAHGEPVAIDLVQTRIDVRGAVTIGGLLDSLQFRGAYGDYRHIEFEGAEEGTRFDGEGYEFRADLVQSERGGWRGRSGFQLQARRLALVGPEAFTPDNEIGRFGVFTLQALQFGGGFGIEAAGRYERAGVKASTIGFDRSFDLWSGALGASWQPTEDWKLGINYIRGARGPAPEELLADGLHVATQAFEIGDSSFAKETSDGLEAYVRYTGDRVSLSATAYRTDFDGFISAVPTGDEREGFPVFQYVQLPARFVGFEAEGSLEALRWDGGSLKFDAAADYTRARLKGAGPVPRIPPLRLRGGAELETGEVHLRAEVEWSAAQKRVAAFENRVRGFTLVNASVDWHPMGEDGPLTLIFAADNIFGVVGRRSSSFTRDFVPIAGRDLRMTAKFDF